MQTIKRITTSVLFMVVIMHICTPFVFAGEKVFDNEYDYYEALYSDFDPDDVYILKSDGNKKNWFDDEISLFSSTSSGTKAYPNWDQSTLNMIDLNSIPKEVYDIIHSDNRLIVIQVWSASYRIFVLRNGFLYNYAKCTDWTDVTTVSKYNTNSCFGFGTRIWDVDGSDEIDSIIQRYMSESCCWMAVYKYDGTISTDWTSYTASNMNSNFVRENMQGKMKIYTGELSVSTCDFYQMGGSHLVYGSSTFEFGYNSYITAANYASSETLGLFMRNHITGTSATSHTCSTMGSYLSTDQLTFPTYESQTNDTQKGILQRIKELPQQISSMLTTLKNYLLYFSSEEVERPESPFADVLETVSNFTDERLEDLTAFRDSMNSNLDDVEDYISTGSGIINDFITGVPIIGTILVFVLAIIVIRKVVGR